MATDFIDQLRKASFPTERRGGYSPDAVDAYLAQLADWLETGGDDQTRAALVQREMERVGERTGAILSAAQQSADSTAAEAKQAAEEVRATAERDASETRAAADAYATETRSSADTYAEEARTTADAYAEETRSGADAYLAKERTDADGYAEQARTGADREADEITEAAGRAAAQAKAEADEHAKLTIREADSSLERAERAAAERTEGIETEIADLARKRDDVAGILEELATNLRSLVEGPGRRDLELPDRIAVLAEAAAPPTSRPKIAAHPDPGVDTETVAEHAVVEPTAAFTPDFDADDDQTPRPDDASEPHREPTASEDETRVDPDREPTAEDEFDTDERERRRRSVDDQPTDETTVTDLL